MTGDIGLTDGRHAHITPSTLDKRLLARLLRTDCICTTSKGEFSWPTGDCWSLSARGFDHRKTPAARRLFAFVRRAPEEYISMSRSVVSHNLAVLGQTVFFFKPVCWLCLVWRKLSTGCYWKRAKQRENGGEIGPFGGMPVTFCLNNATNLKAALTLARSF